MEWHRSKSIQRLDKVYRAEDRGVWLRADAADERLTVEAQRRPVDSRAKTAARLQDLLLMSIVKVILKRLNQLRRM